MPKRTITSAQLRRSNAKREKAAASAPATKLDVVTLFNDLIAVLDKHVQSTNFEIEYPCGTKLKFVCIESAKLKADRLAKREARDA